MLQLKMANIKQFVCMAGLPRSGSTLLSAILSQNPNIHSEGNSAVLPLICGMQLASFEVREQLFANNRFHTPDDLLKSIPNTYYKDINCPIVVDKARGWTLDVNQELLRRITPNPKTIVLTRPLVEVVKSFINLHEENNYSGDLEKRLMEVWWEPSIEVPLKGVKQAKKSNKGEFLFVSYNELVTQTKETIEKIYTFCEWDSFEHNYNEIINKHPEDDTVYKLNGMHDIRSTISKRNLTTQLTPAMLKRCKELDIY